MTLTEIQTLLVTADTGIKHYFSAGTGEAYSYWEEGRRLPMMADDKHQEAWRFYVHRFTRTASDATATALFNALDGDDRVAVKWIVDTENDTGYIHHIFECEGY